MKKIIFFSFLFPHFIFAQIKQKESYTIYVNYPDYTVKTDVLSKCKKLKTKIELTYFWYSSNKIMETTGGFDGKILNGPYTSFYLTNNLKEKGYFKRGLKNGEWITWYDNGKIKEINEWQNGLKSKLSRKFDKNGDLIVEAKYKSGKLNGYQTTYENGKIIEKRKYKNGIEVIKEQKNKRENGKEQTVLEKHHNKMYVKYKALMAKVKTRFDKKDKEKELPKNNAKKTPLNKKSKKTIREKIKMLFNKKDTSKKSQKNQHKDK